MRGEPPCRCCCFRRIDGGNNRVMEFDYLPWSTRVSTPGNVRDREDSSRFIRKWNQHLRA